MTGRSILLTAALTLIFVACPNSIVKATAIDGSISTGDNHFLCTSLPVESPAGIAATFDLLKDIWGVRRIYWRGLQEAQDAKGPLRVMIRQGTHPRTASFWNWANHLITNENLEQIAVQAAHDRGIELWGLGNLFDWGSTGDTSVGTYYGYPYGWESLFRVQHREWIPVDKYGTIKQAGPFEFSYPEVRQAVKDTYVNLAVEAGYDGVCFYTYAENYGMRFAEQFGYNDPIVEEFKNRYGVDIRTEPFNKTDWINLRGEYTTQFLGELKTALSPYGIKIGIVLNRKAPDSIDVWPYSDGLRTSGEINMDYKTWSNNQTVDELILRGTGLDVALMVKEDVEGTGTGVSMKTSSPYSYTGYCISVVISFGGAETSYLLRSNIYPQLLSALSDPNQYKRMCVLAQIIEGKTPATPSDVLPLASDPHLLVRRLALRALGVIGEAVAVPTIEAALFDPESAIRNSAITGLQKVRGSNTSTMILDAVDQYGNFMFNNAAGYALHYCTPSTTVRAQLADAIQNHANHMVREVAGYTLARYMYNTDVVSAFINTLFNDPCDNVRQYAAEGLGNINNSPAGVQALIDAVALDNVAVSERAAQSLGKLFGRSDPAAEAVRPQVLDALGALYSKLGSSGCQRSDVDWGYRPIGDALLATGDDGRALLESYYNQRKQQRLAQMAWLSLYMPQNLSPFTIMTEQEYDELFEKRPKFFSMNDLTGFTKEWLKSGMWP
ncbi:MAG: HEAT repeat domain-containing protein [Sedimentisphaerales bacterium]|nr:HEAT repeat domain-containing protein [Sedimentisphaerales bacterium]